MKFAIISSIALALGTSAKVIKVEVAQDGFSFTPNKITAAVGDQIAYHFDGSGHDVTQGDFSNACQPYSTNPFYAGTVAGGSTWTYTVKNTNPTAFYCSPHCRLGMVGVINGKGAKTYAKFLKNAKAASSSSHPATVQGGTLS